MIGRELKKPETDDSDIKLWFYRLEKGIQRRKEEEPRWKRNRDFVEGRHWEGKEGEGDEPTTNKVGSWVDTRLSALCFRNPHLKLIAEQSEGSLYIDVPTGETDPETQMPVTVPASRVKVTESLLNKVTNKPGFGFNASNRRIARSGLTAYGVGKVGYRAEFKDVPDETEQQVSIDQETGMVDFSQYMTDPGTGDLIRDDDGRLIPKNAAPISEGWFWDCVKPDRMIIDPDGESDFREHRWVAYEYLRPLKEVKKDRLLKNTKDLEATGDTEEPDEPDPKTTGIVDGTTNLDLYVKEYTEQVRLFEIFDFENSRLIVLADGHDKWLRNDPIPVGIDHSPYVFFRPSEREFEFYQIPPVSRGVPINDEYNKASKQRLALMRKTLRKYLMAKGAFDTVGRESLTNNQDSTISEVKSNIPFDQAIGVVPVPQISGEVFANIQQIARDFDEAMGQPAESRGASQAKTATAVNELSGRAMMREEDMKSIYAGCLAVMGKKLLDSIQKNMTIPQAVEIEGPEGQLFMGYVDHNMIVGDYDVSVDIAELAPPDSALIRAQKERIMVNVGQSPWLFSNEGSARGWLEDYPNLAKNDQFIRDVVAAAQLQMQMLLAPKQPETSGAGSPQDASQMTAQQGGASAQ